MAMLNVSGWNLKGVQFTRPGAPLKSWAVVSFDQRFGVQDMRESAVRVRLTSRALHLLVCWLLISLTCSLCPVLNAYGEQRTRNC